MTKFHDVCVLAMLAACGGEGPVSYSSRVGINLKAKSSDVSFAARE